MIKYLFGVHRVRDHFYHLVSAVFVVSTLLWLTGTISDKTNAILSAILFITDYLAHMYDPNPENSGPWFKRHFHRFVDGDDNEENILRGNIDDRTNDK